MVATTPLHASAFAYQGAGCLVLGDAGAGKSRVLAEAMQLGATLIADDRVLLSAMDGVLMAQAPASLEGVLEMRGMGLITVPFIAPHPIHFAVTLGDAVPERLPEMQRREFAGVSIPHCSLAQPPQLSVASVLLYLKAVHENRTLPTDWRPTR